MPGSKKAIKYPNDVDEISFTGSDSSAIIKSCFRVAMILDKAEGRGVFYGRI
jgi:hypothetical protein